jgi:hypothetical protein
LRLNLGLVSPLGDGALELSLLRLLGRGGSIAAGGFSLGDAILQRCLLFRLQTGPLNLLFGLLFGLLFRTGRHISHWSPPALRTAGMPALGWPGGTGLRVKVLDLDFLRAGFSPAGRTFFGAGRGGLRLIG